MKYLLKKQKEDSSITVCGFVLCNEFLGSKFKNGPLRPIIHEVHVSSHFSLWDAFVLSIAGRVFACRSALLPQNEENVCI